MDVDAGSAVNAAEVAMVVTVETVVKVGTLEAAALASSAARSKPLNVFMCHFFLLLLD